MGCSIYLVDENGKQILDDSDEGPISADMGSGYGWPITIGDFLLVIEAQLFAKSLREKPCLSIISCDDSIAGVLPCIMEHFDLKTLGSASLVSKSWYKESLKHWKRICNGKKLSDISEDRAKLSSKDIFSALKKQEEYEQIQVDDVLNEEEKLLVQDPNYEPNWKSVARLTPIFQMISNEICGVNQRNTSSLQFMQLFLFPKKQKKEETEEKIFTRLWNVQDLSPFEREGYPIEALVKSYHRGIALSVGETREINNILCKIRPAFRGLEDDWSDEIFEVFQNAVDKGYIARIE